MIQHKTVITLERWIAERADINKWFVEHQMCLHFDVNPNSYDYVIDGDNLEIFFYTERLAFEFRMTFG